MTTRVIIIESQLKRIAKDKRSVTAVSSQSQFCWFQFSNTRSLLSSDSEKVDEGSILGWVKPMITQIGDSLHLPLPRLKEPHEATPAFAGDNESSQ